MNHKTSMADEQLIQYFLNNDPNAMATLVALYKDRIYNSIYSMVQDKYQADEIFRSVFMKIIDNMMAGKTVEEGTFMQWALHTAHSLCIEHSRKITQAAPVTATVAEPDANSFVPATVTPNLSIYESHHKIRNMIDQLPEQQREVLVLNHYAGLGFREIANIMKCSLTNALETMRFGLNNLRKVMIEKEMGF